MTTVHPLRALAFSLVALLALACADTAWAAPADMKAWQHTGTVHLLTTPEGANLPAEASLEHFPILVRLHKDFFDFSAAKSKGEDLRFTAASGELLAHQIETWDAAAGHASIWVRLPLIRGNARQAIHLHWGNADAAAVSDGKAVFNSSNGYLGVWHMHDEVKDETGTLESKDTGTTATTGIIGQARYFPGKAGIFCGDKITTYPSGAASHSTQAWFRITQPNATIIGWGNEGGGRGSKIRMMFRSPPHIKIDSDFSDVKSDSLLPINQWIHVVHTYDRNDGRIYINGKLDGAAKPTLDIKSPSRFWIGGWYHNYDYIGDIDEVRVSTVARSAHWIKLEYENQKPLQSLVGPLVQAGSAFAVTPDKITIAEGQSITVTAQAGGAQKIYWLLKRDGEEEAIVAVDRFNFTFHAGRVTGNATATLRLKAIFPSATKTLDIPITITEAIPEPAFTLTAPAHWDGRTPIEVVPVITNLPALKAAGASDLHLTFTTADLAVTKLAHPDKLLLTRAQNDGKLTITATLHNGGQPATQSATIDITQPKRDPWIARVPDKNEAPVDNQFFGRDDKNEGTLHYQGSVDLAANPAAANIDALFLRVTADGQPYQLLTQKLAADKSYRFTVKLKPGLIKYKTELGYKTNNNETILHTASNLICGDAYLIQGQSNAVATDFGKDDPTFRSDWIRSYGTTAGNPTAAPLFGNALHRSRDAGKFAVGYWGMELARELVEKHKIPICLINGAVGGTRIDQHQRNDANPQDLNTIYGRLLWRTEQARLTHAIRGILWHQGENDQGADGPTGGFGYETYRQYFLELAADWKTDYPNIQHYYVYQIWPKSCSMGVNGSDNHLREVQRQLPTAFSNLHVIATLGIDPPGGCHFPAAGYAQFARLLAPLIERDYYQKAFTTRITSPNLLAAHFTSDKRDELVMQFDQPMQWDDKLISQFYLDGQKLDPATTATLSDNAHRITFKLSTPATAKHLTYLDSKSWSQATLLKGKNNLAALTFCEVPISTK